MKARFSYPDKAKPINSVIASEARQSSAFIGQAFLDRRSPAGLATTGFAAVLLN
jgi:hypothetical protein